MRYTPQLYAQALSEILKDVPHVQQDQIIVNFVRTVGRNGDIRRTQDIIDAVQELQVQNTGGRVVLCEFARELPDVIKERIMNVFSKNDVVKIRVNKSLAAGVRITIDGTKELDHTLKRKLKKLFKQ